MKELKCHWHPNRIAKWIVNLDKSTNESVPLCDGCKTKAMSTYKSRLVRKTVTNGR